MNKADFSKPIELKDIRVTDEYWKKEIELVRTEVIPYQWDAINDKVPGAEPSYCMRNFRIAGELNEKRRMNPAGVSTEKPVSETFRGWAIFPEDKDHVEPDKFYGFVFQDTDFSKWIEAVGYSLTQHPDSALEAIADKAIDVVVAAQQDNGYLDTFFIIYGMDQAFTNLRDHHELYCLGHLIEGAVAYYQATGKDKLLNAAKRYADYVDSCFGSEPDKRKGYPGHEIAEMALVRLYEVTGEDKYLNLSKYFIDERGQKPYYYDSEDHFDRGLKSTQDEDFYTYFQANKPTREMSEATGHAVRAVYLYSGMADIARLFEDEELLDACNRIWDNIVNRRMYITGGIGSTNHGEAFTFDYDLPNDMAYTESCAAIGLMFFARRMLQISPESRYADIMERALYNGVLPGMALDGKSFFYVNPLEVDPFSTKKDTRKEHVKTVRQKWFGCACCPPNIARLISSIGEYAYTESDDTLFVHLYVGSSLTKKINGQNIDISIGSSFPWNGGSSVRVGGAEGTNFRLALRIPDWCEGEYELSGAEDMDSVVKDGYLYISGGWKDNAEIRIRFNMDARLIAGTDEIREDFGRVAVMRGPLVYCLEENDNSKGLYKLAVNSDRFDDSHVEDFEISGNPCKAIYVPGFRRYGADKSEVADVRAAVTGNVATASQIESGLNRPSTSLYQKYEKLHSQKQTLKYIPYYMWANRGENEMTVWLDVE